MKKENIWKAAALTAVLAGACVFGMAGCGSESASGSADLADTVTVSASSTVYLVPDKATVSFGVTTQDKTAEKAQNQNSEAVDKVIKVLTEKGVEEKSIRTTNYSMYPQYDYSENGNQSITGYVVYTNMSVQDQNVDDLGKLISACVEAGINNIDSVSLLCSGYDEAYQQALAKAVEDSRTKAETLASAAGKTLGETVSINEGYQDDSVKYGRNAQISIADAKEAAGVSAPSIQPGESEITANVTVTYRMK